MGEELGFIKKSGAWYSYNGERLGQGKEKVRALLDETPELRDAIEAQLVEYLGMNPKVIVPAEEAQPDPEAGPMIDDMDEEM